MINLTPHEIVIVEAENGTEIASFPASGKIARVSVIEKVTGYTSFDGIPVDIITAHFGKVEGLPNLCDLEGHERFLVSSMVLDQLGSEWSGIAFAPDTGKTAIRNDKNHIIGVTRLRTVSK